MGDIDRTFVPDKGWSWVVAFACCFSSLVLAGIFRTSGVLFVAFISDYGVSREAASWPMVLCISVLNLTGPFSGVLSRKFGGRAIIITGAVVASLGMSACYLTTSLRVITILFGGVFGVGYGFINTILPGILNAYFLNLRATANGIANAGSCIGSILLPIAFEYFIHTYGLSGCFLLTGGIVLHVAIAGALMRPPPWMSSKRNDLMRHGDTGNNPRDQTVLSIKNTQETELPRKNTQASSHESHTIGNAVATPIVDGVTFTDQKDTSLLCSLSDVSTKNTAYCEQKYPPYSVDLEGNIHSGLSENTKVLDVSPFSEENKSVTNRRFCPCCPFGQQRKQKPCGPILWSEDVVQPFRTVLSCPMFYITAVTNVSFYFLYHMYVVIIVDYALDEGVPEDRTKYILFAFSVADLFGRLCLGWVTDRQFVSRSRFVMFCMALIGLVFFVFPFARGYWSLVAVSCSYGLLLGSTMVLFPVLLVDFLGIELHSVSYGCMCFMNGFASFGRPFLIGYFRDSVGSYSNMFYVLGTISAVASTLWLLQDLFDKKKSLYTLNNSC